METIEAVAVVEMTKRSLEHGRKKASVLGSMQSQPCPHHVDWVMGSSSREQRNFMNEQ